MTELPKIARERLQAGGGGPHPDADLLSAFAERCLEGGERESVLQHLAACAECREVVALAQLPADEGAVERVPPVAAKPGWMSWYRLTWAALAACLVVGAAVVFMQRDKTPEETAYVERSATAQYTEQDKAKKAPAAAPEKQVRPAAAAPAVPATSEKKQEALAKAEPKPQVPAEKDALAAVKTRAKEREEARNADEVATTRVGGAAPAYTGGIPAGATSANQVNQPAASAEVANAPAMDRNTYSMGGAAKSAPAQAARADMGASRDQRAATAPEVAPGHAAMSQSPAATQAQMQAPAAAPPSSQSVEVTSEAVSSQPSRNVANLRSLTPVLRLQWSVTENGHLQASGDHGASWMPVAVANGVFFRGVSSVGQQVWAAGNTSDSGVVWHSTDDGHTWKLQHKFPPMSNGASVQVSSITFSDVKHGKLIVTRSGIPNPQTWTTRDGGTTWEPELSGR